MMHVGRLGTTHGSILDPSSHLHTSPPPPPRPFEQNIACHALTPPHLQRTLPHLSLLLASLLYRTDPPSLPPKLIPRIAKRVSPFLTVNSLRLTPRRLMAVVDFLTLRALC